MNSSLLKTITEQESVFDKHKCPRKHKIIKQMFSVIAYFSRKQNCKDNSSYNVKLGSRNDFDSVGDLELM